MIEGMISTFTWYGTLAIGVVGFLVGLYFFATLHHFTPRAAAAISAFITSAWYIGVMIDVSIQGDNFGMGRVIGRFGQTLLFGAFVGIGVWWRRRSRRET